MPKVPKVDRVDSSTISDLGGRVPKIKHVHYIPSHRYKRELEAARIAVAAGKIAGEQTAEISRNNGIIGKKRYDAVREAIKQAEIDALAVVEAMWEEEDEKIKQDAAMLRIKSKEYK